MSPFSLICLCFFLLKLLKLGEIDGVKFLARKSGRVNFWTNSMSAEHMHHQNWQILNAPEYKLVMIIDLQKRVNSKHSCFFKHVSGAAACRQPVTCFGG